MPVSLHSAIGAVVDALTAREDELVELMMARIRVEAPEALEGDDPAVLLAGTESCHANIHALLGALRGGREMPEDPPAAALAEAAVCAQAGIPLDALLQTYRIGHSTIWEAAMDETERQIDDPGVRRKVVRLVSRFLFAYIDTTVPRVALAYQRERETRLRDSERRRRQMVRDVLDGLPIDETRWAYDLAGTHVAVIGWGAHPEPAIVAMAEQAACGVITVPGPADVVWGWLGGRALSAGPVPAFDPGPGTFLAVGEAMAGIRGFRDSHAQARRAQRVAGLRPAAVTRYRDVALLAIALQDEGLARAFAAEELGELAADEPRAAVLRATLGAYFRSGQNAAAAAAALGVHDRTVAYRIRSVEEKLGCSVTARRDELSLALRIVEALPGRGRSGRAAEPA